MFDLADLYQQLIIDHNKSPRNRGRLEDANCHAEGYNPLCGDRVALDLRVKDNVVENVAFEGSGCAISTAAVSLLTQSVKGKTVEEADALFKAFQEMVTGDGSSDGLGKLAAFSGVRQFPARVKCATLAWHTLKAALHSNQDVVTTE